MLLPVLLGLAALVVLFVLLFDWNWLRRPMDDFISRKTQRTFTSSDLHVRLGFTPTIRLRGLHFSNAPWAEGGSMADVGELEFSVSLRELLAGRFLVPRVALTDADLHFERAADGRKNWTFSEPGDTSPSKLRISSLSVTRGQLQYRDRGVPFDIKIAVGTFDPAAAAQAGHADAAPQNKNYTTRYAFDGHYHDAAFSGQALTGSVLSFQESGIAFPLFGHLVAGKTRLDVEGTVADTANLSAIDVRLKMSGQTLANLYPFLLLPLPASPPYRIEGRLTLNGNRYGLDDIRGQIGATDLAGHAAYLSRRPRPLLQSTLHSRLLDMADLGPLIGVTSKSATTTAPPTQAQTQTRATARATERQTNGERVLPAGTPAGERLLPTGRFEGGRLKAIDVDADFAADRVRAPDQLNVSNVKVVAHLQDGLLKLEPANVDFAGGRIESTIDLDARKDTLAASAEVRARDLKLADLMPRSPRIVASQGRVDADVRLRGTGNSIADLAAQADGTVSATLSSGTISNLLDAAAGLNGGKVIRLLVGGDKDIPVRCGAARFQVQDGKGQSRLFVVDTAQTRIDASGSFNLDDERFDLLVRPQPKQAGILSLRTPLRLYGSFRHPDYELQKSSLALRAGGALALAAVAPIAALIPLIETGPGADVDCARLHRVALQADSPVQPAASASASASALASASASASAEKARTPTTR